MRLWIRDIRIGYYETEAYVSYYTLEPCTANTTITLVTFYSNQQPISRPRMSRVMVDEAAVAVDECACEWTTKEMSCRDKSRGVYNSASNK
jgi:hypothetical protein